MQLPTEIWQSFRRMPRWVQIWVAFILVPVNISSVVLAHSPGGILIAVLAIGGLLPNVALMFLQRGFSRAMAPSHVALWTPLVVILWQELVGGQGLGSAACTHLAILLTVDLVSLGFDFPDTIRWIRGQRDIT